MKICWDNLEKVRLNINGNLVINNDIYIEKDACKQCGEPFLAAKRKLLAEYCCKACGKLGKPRPEWVKKKVSETRVIKGVARGKNNPMYGKKRFISKEIRQKISETMKGKHTGKKNPMYGKAGELSPAWRGGLSFEPYCIDWTKEYKEYIKERDGNKCLNPYCCCDAEILCVHHIDYNKKNCKPNNVITVCRNCNSRANKDREWHESWYKAIIQKRYGGIV